jgi:putative transposase
MRLVEQHRINRHDARFIAIDAATFASKNLYNAALYRTRQAYIFENHCIIGYAELDKLMQPTLEYRALPAKVAQWVVKQVCAAWDSYFAAVAEWHIHPEKFKGHPKLPKYLAKNGRNLLVYTSLGRAIPCTDPRRNETGLCRDSPGAARAESHPLCG